VEPSVCSTGPWDQLVVFEDFHFLLVSPDGHHWGLRGNILQFLGAHGTDLIEPTIYTTGALAEAQCQYT
jgi:hypothetical protein